MTKGGKLTKIKSVLKKIPSFKLGRPNTTSAAALHAVYVGKSRRRYLITSDVMEHPVFRELVDLQTDGEESITIGCEVVLFEHLLWMLENADPQPELMNELVQFYR